MNEKKRIDEVSDWYLRKQLDFDKCLIGYRYRALRQYIRGPLGLELGPADGQMTRFLISDFQTLTIVDAASKLLKQIPSYPNLIKIHSLFEEYNPRNKFDTIIMEHILEHVSQPVKLLRRVQKWLVPNGRVLLGVPNGNSIHRLVATKMGLLKGPCELNSRDLEHGHRRVYTRETFRRDIESAGLKLVEMGGVFFKPLSNKQIQDNWTKEMIEGFYELGKDFQEFAAEIYAVCQI